MSEMLTSPEPSRVEFTIVRSPTGFRLCVRESRTGAIRLERDLANAPLEALRDFDPGTFNEDNLDRVIESAFPLVPELSYEEERAALRELSETAPSTESLRRIIKRHPVPEAYHDEPGWGDDVDP